MSPGGRAVTWWLCQLPLPAPGRAVPESLSWSPNSHALAYVAGGYLTAITPPTLKSCAGASVQRMLRNVTDPYWTAANIKPKG